MELTSSIISESSPVGEAARFALRFHLESVLRYLPMAAGSFSKDDEYVHLLRVAIRRSAAAIKLYQELLPKKNRRWLLRKLGRLRQVAGNARDLDVTISRLSKSTHLLPRLYSRVLRRRRKKLQRPIRKCFAKLCHHGLLERKIGELIESATMNGIARQAYGEWALSTSQNMVRCFLDSIPETTCDLESLHNFRRRVKAVRYGLELLAMASPSERITGFFVHIEELQNKLGKINDLAVVTSILESCNRGGIKRRSKDFFRKSLSELRTELDHSLVQFSDWWTRQRVIEFTDTLVEMVEGAQGMKRVALLDDQVGTLESTT